MENTERPKQDNWKWNFKTRTKTFSNKKTLSILKKAVLMKINDVCKTDEIF